MSFEVYQSCRSNEGWQIVRIPSENFEENKMIYTVHVSPWKAEEGICECPGFMFRGHCKHQELAWEKVCRWTDQRRAPGLRAPGLGPCPKCGGPTKFEIEVR